MDERGKTFIEVNIKVFDPDESDDTAGNYNLTLELEEIQIKDINFIPTINIDHYIKDAVMQHINLRTGRDK